MKRSHVLGWRRRLVELALVTCATCGAVLTMPGASPHIVAATPAAVDPVSNWNAIALQAAAAAGESAIVQSRTLAIVQVAIHDALNAIESSEPSHPSHGPSSTRAFLSTTTFCTRFTRRQTSYFRLVSLTSEV